MREYPIIDEVQRSRDFVTTFGGYNHKPDCAEGEWYDQSGLTSDLYPILSTRQKRAVCDVASNVNGMISKDNLYICKGTGLYVENLTTGTSTQIAGITLDAFTEKQMVGMGTKLYIFPDKIWYDTSDGTYGLMEFDADSSNNINTSAWATTLSSSELGSIATDFTGGDDGKTLREHKLNEGYTWLDSRPSTMTEKTIWKEMIDDYAEATTSSGRRFAMHAWKTKWYENKTENTASIGVQMSLWGADDFTNNISEEGEYVKLVIPSTSFVLNGETVNQSVAYFMKYMNLNAMCSKEHGSSIWEQTADMDVYYCYLYAKPIKDLVTSYQKKIYFPDWHTDYTVNVLCSSQFICGIEKATPDMAYIVEHNNRLWGCSRDGHEIYASALGNGTAWKTYQGIATDSYAATVGSDGIFTGATVYNDSPIFFKRDRMLKVYVSSTGAHQYKETECKGVQEGSSASIVNVNNTLFYKSDSDIVAYNGSIPFSISDKFGGVHYHSASAGRFRDKYYISMKDENDKSQMFSYDTKTSLWIHEGQMNAKYFTVYDNNLLYWSGGVLVMTDGSKATITEDGIMLENDIDWFCESGNIGYSSPDSKYVARLSIRYQLNLGSRMSFYISYDDGSWEHVFNLNGKGLRSFTIPFVPRRCDHYRYKIKGHGDVKIFSISKTIEEGSDIT